MSKLDALEREVVEAAVRWAEADFTGSEEQAEDELAVAVDRLRRAKARERLTLVMWCHAPDCGEVADGGHGYCLRHALLLSLEESQQREADHG